MQGLPISRRTLLRALWGLPVAAAAWVGGRTLAPLVVAAPDAGRSGRRLLGPIEDLRRRLEASRMRAVVLDDAKLVLVPAPEGAPPSELPFVAYSLLCTHLGCTLRPSAGGERLDCPCHGSRFTLASEGDAGVGQVLQGPATRPLPRLQLVRVDDKVYVEATG